MAFLLLKYEEETNTKGILIFKHLEINLLTKIDKNLINKLKERYILGMYFGFYYILNQDIKDIDFYVAEDNVIEYRFNSTTPRINLNGYNFIGNEYENIIKKDNKLYDFIFIGSASRRKGLKQLLSSINKIATTTKLTPQIVIINRVSGGIYMKILNRIVKQKLDEIPKKFRKNITYIELDSTTGYQLPKYLIKELLCLSKTLILPSRDEGCARVVAEAQLMGLNIISYKYMNGGTNNHLTKYDILYDNFSDMSTEMIENLNNYNNFYSKKDISFNEIYLEKYSKQTFAKELSRLFNYDFKFLNDKFNDIVFYNSISSHNTLLPREYSSNPFTDEIYSYEVMSKLITWLSGEKDQSVIVNFIYKYYDLYYKIKKYVILVSRKLKII